MSRLPIHDGLETGPSGDRLSRRLRAVRGKFPLPNLCLETGDETALGQ
jgi:hypothetical protein